MSFDVYVQFFVAGDKAGVAADVVREAFAGLMEVLDEDYWLLRFGDATTTDLFVGPLAADVEVIHSLAFHRPADDFRLWEGIWGLLGVAGAVFHFPGGGAPWVRAAASIRQLSPEMANARVVGDVEALRNSVESAKNLHSM